jgi:cyclopropane fatty-acyl-phospholipid synthase-like methyltransferase
MKRSIGAAWLALTEALSKPTLQRVPEPASEMNDTQSVEAFHAQGSDEGGALLGVYHFNARAVHALAPEGSTVLDLGCGSGQCLRYIAQRRPDLRFIGLDLSENMVSAGNAMLRKEGLSDRVMLQVGDMTSFSRQAPAGVRVVTSIFSLHHLPTLQHLYMCLKEVQRLRKERGVALWIFDHARPRRASTARTFPTLFTPNASKAFNNDSTNSLIASWSFDELSKAIGLVERDIHSSLARHLPLYQTHWIAAPSASSRRAAAFLAPTKFANASLRDANALWRLFSDLPN